MSKEFRYKLEKGSKKYLCPHCGKKSFVRYLDTREHHYLPEQYGRCDHETHCGYFLNPYKTGYADNQPEEKEYMPLRVHQPQPLHFMPEEVLNSTLNNYDKNIFIQNLLKIAPPSEVEKLISLYRLGTISQGSRAGAVTLPFIDIIGNIRTIQAKQFDAANHTISTDFVHSILIREYAYNRKALPGWLQSYSKNEKFVSCLFGEHLLHKFPINPVALVEAPKTAIIGTLYYGIPASPTELLWLAVYNKSSLSFEKCKPLKGRKIILFPDLNAFTEWSAKANQLRVKLSGTRIEVSDLLEKYATETEKSAALDLADYLTRFDQTLFQKDPPVSEPVTVPDPEPKIPNESLPDPILIPQSENEKSENSESLKQSFFSVANNLYALPILDQKSDSSNEIQSLESFFNSIILPDPPIRLNQCCVILDLPKFISGHLAILKKYNGNPVFLPYFQRLQQLQQILKSSST